MNKTTLEKITSPYTAEQIIAAAKTRGPANDHCYAHPWFTSAWISELDEKVLVFDIHSLKNLQHNNFDFITGMRIFIWADSFITRVYTGAYKSKWITGTLSTITGYSGYFEGYVDTASMNAFREFFGEMDSDDPIRLVYRFQSNIGEIRLAAKHERILNRIDAEMSTVPEIPASFHNWIDETALYSSRYVFYDYKKTHKPLDGYCSHCKQMVKVIGAKHNATGVCPNCKSKIIYKAVGKSARIQEREQAYLLQRTRDGRMVLRIFFCYKDYGRPQTREYLSAKSTEHEVVRGIFKRNGNGHDIRWYEWFSFKTEGPIRWCDDCSRIPVLSGAIYSRNLHQVLEGSTWKYSGMHALATHEQGYKLEWSWFLQRSATDPVMEYLIKSKLWNLAAGLINNSPSSLNRDAKKLHQALGVRKEQLPMLQAMNATWEEVNSLQEFNNAAITVSADELRYFSNSWFPEEALRFLKNTTPHRLMRYAVEASKDYEKSGNTYGYAPHFFPDWKDYMGACELLQLDTHSEFVLFPKDFKEAHDSRTKEAAAVKQDGIDRMAKERFAEIDPAIQAAMRKLPKKFNEFRIITPTCAKDIRDEGTALKHCVGGYVETIARGEAMILFIRAAAELEKPLYTAEFRKGKIVQCRGYANSMKVAVPPIVIELMRWFEGVFQTIQQGKAEQTSCA